jgi:ribosomal protein S18 acetylase RimI-like enzyme
MIWRNPKATGRRDSGLARQADVTIRRVAGSELDAVRDLVAGVVEEVYGTLFPKGIPEDHTDWTEALVAVSHGNIVGVALTSDDTIDDLWVSADQRRRGVGGALLASAESEIQQRHYRLARLRVIADNVTARRFYAAHRWSEAEIYPHERWGISMINMTKDLAR